MFEPPLSAKGQPLFLNSAARSLPDLFLRRIERSAQSVAYMAKRDGQWVNTTFQRFYEQAAELATYLMKQGLSPGDKLCVVGSTRPEWSVCDMGGQLAALVTIGAYPTLAPAQLAYILDHSDTRAAIVEGREEVEKILSVRESTPKLERVVVWRYNELPRELRENPLLSSFEEALRTPIDRAAIDARVGAIKPDDTAILVYTSGTTGPPKGAMLSHKNILAWLRCFASSSPLEDGDISLNFLPMAHVAERVGSYLRLDAGMTAAFASSVPAVLEEVKEVKPTIFASVPRIFEKAYAKIMSEVEKAPPRKRQIFRWAERVGREAVRRWQKGEPMPLGLKVQYTIADRLVFSRLRGVFGGRVRRFTTGAAPIALEILEFFWAAGFPIYEVYGMTEATIITHANRVGKVRLGTVGTAITGMEQKIAEDGEILLRGDTVFRGYYKDPAATEAALDAEGWLRTGDVGRLDEDGYLTIVDRKKHIIITSGGKNITPANIELEIKGNDPLISQVHVHGDRRAYLTAVVTIHPLEAIEWAKGKGLVTDAAKTAQIAAALLSNPLARPEGLAELMSRVTGHDEVKTRVVSAVKRANERLARVETVKKVVVLERDFSAEEDEITPTLKVKRREVEKKYAPVFDRLYGEAGFGLSVSRESE